MNRERLFVASCISIGTAAMVFAIRGDIAGPMTAAFRITNEQRASNICARVMSLSEGEVHTLLEQVLADFGDVVPPAVARPLAVQVGVELPRLGPALAGIAQQRRAVSNDGRARWDAWWEQVSRDATLQPAVAQRRAVFETTYPSEEFSPPADWHIAAMRDAGFAEAGVVWRSGPAAVVAAVR